MVSVIIPVYNDAEPLALCLECLAHQTYPSALTEVLVVDNGSEQDIAPIVATHLPRARLLREPRPGSYAARNKALGEAIGEIIAFTDADCLPEPEWLERGVAALLSDPALGFVAGRVEVFPRDPKRPTGSELYDMTYTLRQDRYLQKNHAGATANIFTHRATVARVGTFNSALRSAGDFEWCQRVWAAGYGQSFGPDAVVRHPARRGLRPLLKKARRVIGGRVDKGERAMPPAARARSWVGSVLPPRDVLPAARIHAAQYGWTAGLRFFGACYAVRLVMLFEELRILMGGSSIR